MNDIKKYIMLSIAVIMGGLMLAGGTYAYFSQAATVTNQTYNVATHCFLVDYNINNVDNTQDITGTMFPSGTHAGGLSGRVTMQTNSSCDINGSGRLVMHIDSETDSDLTSSATSFCQDRKTLEPMASPTPSASPAPADACEAAGGRWRGYSDAYCEDKYTLERLVEYTTSTDCTDNNGVWKTTMGSPLKYAVYDNASQYAVPVSVGEITSANIGNDVVIYDNFLISNIQKVYYIYIWLDGYLTDNTFTDLPFSGYIRASAVQDTDHSNYTFVNYIHSSGTQTLMYPNIAANKLIVDDVLVSSGSNRRFASLSSDASTYASQYWEVNESDKFAVGPYAENITNVTATSRTLVRVIHTGSKITLMVNDDKVERTTVNNQITNFGYNMFGTDGNRFTMNRYDTKIYNTNGILSNELVPCSRKSDSVIGLYDVQAKTFYPGSGTFTSG